ncbi:uncharacterized protein TNCV_1803931 [Trichonephila clavipes]|nr:uncharacterized protein TNCV_1803931 [Trichonephila clavipes]
MKRQNLLQVAAKTLGQIFGLLEYLKYVEQKVCYFRVVSARKTTVRLLNAPRQTSNAICCFKELVNDNRRPGNSQRRERFLFTDEKFFTVQQVHNSQNDRICCLDAQSTSTIVETSPISKAGHGLGRNLRKWQKAPSIFVEEGVKINQKVYRRDIIEAVVLPWDQKHFGNSNWTLLQNSAPVCKAKKIQE